MSNYTFVTKFRKLVVVDGMDVEKKTKIILTQALQYRASDVHFIPNERETIVRFRIDGQLIEIEHIPFIFAKKIIAHLKFISGMDIGEKRRPQNHRLEMTLGHQQVFMRLSTFPSSSLETLVIRLFPQENTKDLQHLSLFPTQANQLHQLMKISHGLIIICGPTGSGKTTTLYSLLQKRTAEVHENIITLEDPVEQKKPQFLQMEINEKAGITYANGLKSLLRHDPDLIMLGEIRDSETARMAVRAALTGHLVFSTLHSSSTKGAIKRLMDLGVPLIDLEEVMQVIVAQKLVDVRCRFCGDDCHIYCRKRRINRRGAVYELLYGGELSECMKRMSEGKDVHLPRVTLNDWIRKGISLGYIPKKEWNRSGKGRY